MNKKRISMILCLVLLFCALSPAAHADVQPRYTHVYSITGSVTISDSDLSTNYGRVKLYNTDYTCDLTLELQQKDGSWDTIKTWTTSGSNVISLTKYWYVEAGYDYRVIVTAEVYDANDDLVETVTFTSDPA